MSEFTKMVADTYADASATNLDSRIIDEQAEDLARRCSYSPGDEVLPIVKKMGGLIEYKNFLEWEKTHDGSILVDGPENFTIFLSNFHGPLRNRFTIMHEIGHYVLHSESGRKKIKAARFGDSLVEREANQFAASFLMPKEKFLAEWNKNNSLTHLTSKFLVSLTAARVRLSYLGVTY